jgi:hypothetical protein
MDKYLFTDGTNGVREVQSQEELKTLIASASQPDKIRIWIFNTNEWINYAGFSNGVLLTGKEKNNHVVKSNLPVSISENGLSKRPANGKGGLKKVLIFILAAAGIFLVYNFTRIKWEKASPLNITAARPSNVPLVNTDSLVQFVEDSRGQKLDKVTKTNLRIRNDWPERITLQLNSDRDISNAGSRYYNAELSIDNSTGYNIDNAVVKLTVWKNNEADGYRVSSTDTFHFNNISYAVAAKRKVDNIYRGDSISVSFQSIRAKVFNFCYSADKKSNYGNNNDRWFCRE